MNKTISFAIVHFTVAFSLVYLMTGGLVALIEPCVNTVAFHFHEKLWQRRTPRQQAEALFAMPARAA